MVMPRVTHTYATCDVVIVRHPDAEMQPLVYVQDFSYDTPLSDPVPQNVRQFIGEGNVRRFDDMRRFTEFLHEVGAVVDNCWVVDHV